jgi:ferrous iron transport protein B
VGGRLTIALVGSPNAGKTSLFNRLTGLRARTANFPGTTVEHRRGHLRLAGREASLVDLPGLYGLEATTAEQRVARQALEGQIPGTPLPDVTVVVLDATNLQRNLFLAGQVVELGRPTVIALNMIDEARRQKLQFDVGVLSEQLGCPVAPVSARTGEGFDALVSTLERVARERVAPAISAELRTCTSCAGCHYAARHDWAERVSRSAIRGDTAAGGRRTEAIDRVLTHRVFGLVCFAAVMLLTFMLIFWIAQYPMDLIDGLFALAGCTLGKWLPAGEFNSLLSNGVVGGVGGLLVFLPQICILFFLLSLLEDSGYLARAALVMDRLMHRVGLPGKAFVPLLSAHACAIPAIMSSRVIEDRRDRLATIMVIPLMTCSARVPVYAMVMSLLFPHQPFKASLLFAGAYALGIVAALVMAFCFRRTLLKGSARPLVIELPNYRWPSLRNALCVTLDRAWVFIKNAGTVILLISLALWALASYPKVSGDQDPGRLTTMDSADTLERARQLEQLEHSYAGRLGRAVQPVFAPLGFDWKTSVGVISSFAAREVIVSTLAVLYGLGDDAAESGTDSLYAALRTSRHPDGTPVFTTAACLSLLVFFVLAMQCLPTQAITRRETGSWRWALLQLGYMTLLAYTAALVTYQSAVLLS